MLVTDKGGITFPKGIVSVRRNKHLNVDVQVSMLKTYS